MGKNRFVKATTKRIEISDGDWIEINERLGYGEEQKLAAAAFGNWVPGQDGDEISLNMANHGIKKIMLWVTDWSFENETGKRVPITRDSVAALDSDTAKEVIAAIDKHDAELQEEKKQKLGS